METKIQHTPGPSNHEHNLGLRKGGFIVCRCGIYIPSSLAAAAPDALSILKELRQFESTPNKDVVTVAWSTIEKAMKLIAKIEGK